MNASRAYGSVEQMPPTDGTRELAAFFELLNQIDTRLKKEDPEYKAKYCQPQKAYEN